MNDASNQQCEFSGLRAHIGMRFIEDDLEELKAQGCVAETLRAEIPGRSCAGANE